MKITITGTAQDAGREVSISQSTDNLTMTVAKELVRDALLAWGFQRENIDEAFGDELFEDEGDDN